MPMTDDQLTEHRLKQLEEIVRGARQTEREVDLLKVHTTRLESLMVELRTEVRERDQHTRASLARLHTRFDELAAGEHFEQGAQAARSQMWKTVAGTIAAVTAIGGVALGIVMLFMG